MSGFSNAVVGGAETLIRSAIKSVNYVLGLAGWRITRDGNAELNDATIRGTLLAGGGAVKVSSTGIHIEGSGHQLDVNASGGFVARDLPDDGIETQIAPGGIFLTPQKPSPGGNNPTFTSFFVGYNNPGAANESTFTALNGVGYSGKSSGFIEIDGQAANDANPDNTSFLRLGAFDIAFQVGSTKPSYQRGEYGAFTLSFGPANNATVAVTFAKTYASAPAIYLNIDSGAGATARWCPRAINRTATGFTYFVFAADAVAATWANIPLSWTALDQS
jgi:hypothetical protein